MLPTMFDSPNDRLLNHDKRWDAEMGCHGACSITTSTSGAGIIFTDSFSRGIAAMGATATGNTAAVCAKAISGVSAIVVKSAVVSLTNRI